MSVDRGRGLILRALGHEEVTHEKIVDQLKSKPIAYADTAWSPYVPLLLAFETTLSRSGGVPPRVHRARRR